MKFNGHNVEYSDKQDARFYGNGCRWLLLCTVLPVFGSRFITLVWLSCFTCICFILILDGCFRTPAYACSCLEEVCSCPHCFGILVAASAPARQPSWPPAQSTGHACRRSKRCTCEFPVHTVDPTGCRDGKRRSSSRRKREIVHQQRK